MAEHARCIKAVVQGLPLASHNKGAVAGQRFPQRLGLVAQAVADLQTGSSGRQRAMLPDGAVYQEGWEQAQIVWAPTSPQGEAGGFAGHGERLVGDGSAAKL